MFVWTLRFGSSPGSVMVRIPAVLQSAFPVHLPLWEDKLLDLGREPDRQGYASGRQSAPPEEQH